MSTARYQGGVIAVVATVAISFVICAFTVTALPAASARAGHALGGQPIALGTFSLTERSGEAVSDGSLSDRVWIASFIFTRCPSSCPRISAVMKALQSKLEDTDVQLVSVSVDPDHDTPNVLGRYADSLGASAERWWFLTGPKRDVRALIFDQFKVSVADATPEQQAQGSEDVIHSTRLALVERGNRVVGYYDADNPAEVAALATRAGKLANPWASVLPTWNACLNGACAILLLIGWVQIRSKRVAAHRWTMLAALFVSAVFLASYLTYHFLVVRGSVPFQGIGRVVRLTYFTILLSHTVLAIAMVPLVVMTVLHALRGRFDRHTRWSKITFPIWVYVSVTGVIVYLMLYQLDFSGSAGLVH